MARRKLETLSKQMFCMLLVLNEELCGVEIVEKVSLLTEGRIQLGPGTLYTILSQFEETKIEGRRHSYQITFEGSTLLEEERMRLQQMLLDCQNYFVK